jgi:hypothetical protein
VQDGASPHKALHVRQWLNDNVPQVLKLPSIKCNRRGMAMDEKLYQAPKTQTIEDLEYEIEQAWNKVTVEMCNACIDHVCDKLPQIIERKGEFIKT